LSIVFVTTSYNYNRLFLLSPPLDINKVTVNYFFPLFARPQAT